MLTVYIIFSIIVIYILLVLSLAIFHFKKETIHSEWQKEIKRKNGRPMLKSSWEIKKKEIDEKYRPKIERIERGERFLKSLIPFIKIN